jgi:hypothetical protein
MTNNSNKATCHWDQSPGFVLTNSLSVRNLAREMSEAGVLVGLAEVGEIYAKRLFLDRSIVDGRGEI